MGKTQPAGTATVFERTQRGLTVVVVRDMIRVDWHPDPIADRYLITTNTGFRAEFRACYADRCLDGSTAPCSCDVKGTRSESTWRAHRRETCHGWHDVRAVAFSEKVLGSVVPSRGRTVGAKTGYYLPQHFVPCGWPVERTGRVVRFSDGLDRPMEYGYDVHSPIVAPDHESTS
jgi:hypothetical protein